MTNRSFHHSSSEILVNQRNISSPFKKENPNNGKSIYDACESFIKKLELDDVKLHHRVSRSRSCGLILNESKPLKAAIKNETEIDEELIDAEFEKQMNTSKIPLTIIKNIEARGENRLEEIKSKSADLLQVVPTCLFGTYFKYWFVFFFTSIFFIFWFFCQCFVAILYSFDAVRKLIDSAFLFLIEFKRPFKLKTTHTESDIVDALLI